MIVMKLKVGWRCSPIGIWWNYSLIPLDLGRCSRRDRFPIGGSNRSVDHQTRP